MSDVAETLRRLTIAFTEFEGRLEQTPLIRKLTPEGLRGLLAELLGGGGGEKKSDTTRMEAA